MAGSLVAMEMRTIPVANKNGVSSCLKDDYKMLDTNMRQR